MKDILDEIEKEAYGCGLYSEGEGGVVDVAREDVDDAREMLDAKLASDVMDEVGECRACQRA